MQRASCTGVRDSKQLACRLLTELVWVKSTARGNLAKCHGYYLQHAKEVCLVGLRGDPPPGWRGGLASDVIAAERRGQSQKPEEVYRIIEDLVPGGVPAAIAQCCLCAAVHLVRHCSVRVQPMVLANRTCVP